MPHPYVYRKCDMGEQQWALLQLLKVAKKLHRMVTPKRFYRPLLKGIKWSPPSPLLFRGYVQKCKVCKRDCQGQHCRECLNKRQWKVYRDKKRADDLRLALVQKSFSTVVKRKEIEMAKTGNTKALPIARSTSGLREVIFEEMEALRNGTSNPQRARSMAAMANSILQSVQVEIEYHKYVNSGGRQVAGAQKTVALGTNISLVQEAA